MSEWVQLDASDGHQLSAWVAQPAAEPIAALVVIQEIYGVNHHIRNVTDRLAADGFFAIAPALFDRIEKNVDLGYEGTDAERARTFVPRNDIEKNLIDTQAAVEYAARITGKKVGVIGYCLGGTVAWLAATRLKIDAAVGYYGGGISKAASAQLHCPVMLHFGKQDLHIPPESITPVEQAHPEVPIFWYDAGHGFSCDERASYNADAAAQARGRSLAFLKEHLSQ
jgi:carboxymethylenebutenolidase